MGCDIHAYVEHLETGVNEPYWNFVTEIDLPRDYAVFAVVANVRNYDEVIPISKPKGLPSDVSWWVKHESDSWDTDGHSHSWLSVSELKKAIESVPELFIGRKACIEYRATIAFMEVLNELVPDSTRLVFWFDN